MFYYLHLTRPPPEQAHPSQPLLITPNIANDLRTEFPSPGEKGIDIFDAWVKCIMIEPRPSVDVEAQSSDSDSDKKRDLRGSDQDHTGNENMMNMGMRMRMRYRLGPMTQPRKLTTWRGNSYKEVQVFPPNEAAQSTGGAGSRWQLLLCTRSSFSINAVHEEQGAGLGSYATSIDLFSEMWGFGECVFPILSAPVLFTAGGTKGSGVEKRKQVRNERLFRVPSPTWRTSSSIGPLRVMEHLSYDLDKKVWDSGVGLSHWLVSTMLKASNIELEGRAGLTGTGNDTIPAIVKELMQTRSATILELGTGTGLVSIVLAALLSHYRRDISAQSEPAIETQTKINIIATDLPSAMEILQSNLSDNSDNGSYSLLPSPSSGASIQAKPVVLDWDDYLDLEYDGDCGHDGQDEQEKGRRKKELPVEIQDGVDFIVMADVTYNIASFPSLVHLLDRLSRLSSPPFHPPPQSHNHGYDRDGSDTHTRPRRTPAVLLAYKERDPEERRLWDMARDIGLRFDEIGRVPGAGGMPVEIYAGTFVRDGLD